MLEKWTASLDVADADEEQAALRREKDHRIQATQFRNERLNGERIQW
jgi:hypothetical protein